MSNNNEQEVWRDIPNFYRYQVSSIGRIKNIKTGKILSQFKNPNGYMFAALVNNENKQKNVRVHIIVATCFLRERPRNYDVHHINGIKHDNYYKNLKYISHGRHSYNHNGNFAYSLMGFGWGWQL